MKTRRYPLYPFLAVCALIVSILLSLPCQAADDLRDAAVDKDMQRLKTAMTTKDYTTLIDMMYQPVVEAGGGKDAMLAMSKGMADMVTFNTFEASKPYVYYTGTANDYVVVTTHIIMTIGSQKMDSASFELGVKPHDGGSWQYVDGAGVKPAMRDKFFPDLPKDVVLPEVKHKALD